jgi:hypothetical protein
VVLLLEDDFAPHLVEVLRTVSENSMTAAAGLVSAVATASP